MSENSKIQWTHHTFNPWRGCARVSPGCEHCYAETLSKRNPAILGVWGTTGTRVVASEAMWREPARWNIKAEARNERQRVFCASLADVGEDRPDLLAPRARLCETIFDTPFLDWLLLTKRPQNMRRLFPAQILERCWVGVTAEDQPRANERIPLLLKLPARVRFVSYEPALGLVDFLPWMKLFRNDHVADPTGAAYRTVDWLIVGGESGHGARVFDLAWARAAVEAGRVSGVPVFVKQLGAEPYGIGSLADPKGGNMAEWPADLRVREFPKEAA